MNDEWKPSKANPFRGRSRTTGRRRYFTDRRGRRRWEPLPDEPEQKAEGGAPEQHNPPQDA